MGETHGEIEMKRLKTVAWVSTLSLALVGCSDATEPDLLLDQLDFDVAMVATATLSDRNSRIRTCRIECCCQSGRVGSR